jgi:hypothetical protein
MLMAMSAMSARVFINAAMEPDSRGDWPVEKTAAEFARHGAPPDERAGQPGFRRLQRADFCVSRIYH